MIAKIKQFIHKLKCDHDMQFIRWHWVHFPNSEPLSVEVEYKCDKCKKIEYLHLHGKVADGWARAMGNYKKE